MMNFTKLVNDWLLISIITDELNKLTKLVEVSEIIFSDRGSSPLSSTKYEKVATPYNCNDYKGVALKL